MHDARARPGIVHGTGGDRGRSARVRLAFPTQVREAAGDGSGSSSGSGSDGGGDADQCTAGATRC